MFGQVRCNTIQLFHEIFEVPGKQHAMVSDDIILYRKMANYPF